MKQSLRHAWILVLATTFVMGGMLGCKKKATKPEPRKVEDRTPAQGRTPARPVAQATGKVKDLVCGMTVDVKDVKHTHAHDGKTYYFCNAACKKAFIANPGKYIAKAEPKKTDAKK